MKLNQSLVLALAFLFLAPAAQAVTNNTRASNPSALSIELGGRGFLYSVNFDRVLSDNLAAGFGFGSASSTAALGSMTSPVIPLYFNYYLMPEAGSLYVTAGADFVTAGSALANTSAPSGLNLSSTPFIVTFGLGYEYRSDAGYLVRLAGYGFLGSTFAPWGGISFGYSF